MGTATEGGKHHRAAARHADAHARATPRTGGVSDRSNLSNLSNTVGAGKNSLQAPVCGNAQKVSIGFRFAHAHCEAVAAPTATAANITRYHNPIPP